MEKNSLSSESDFIPRIKADLNRSVFQTGSIFLLLIIFKVWLKIPLPGSLYFLIFILFLTTAILAFYLRRREEDEENKDIALHFLYNLLTVVILTAIVYYAGGITWIMPIFYSFTIVNSFWIYPRNLAILMLGWCCTLFTSLVILQYWHILPGIYIFKPQEQVFENFYYVLLTTFGALVVLFCTGFFSNTFYTLFSDKIEELKKTQRTLKETKKFLLKEVQERTKETERERGKLEKEVIKRTQELESRRKGIQEKVQELEKFHKLAVAKEIKMIGLKEEINKLKRKKVKE